MHVLASSSWKASCGRSWSATARSPAQLFSRADRQIALAFVRDYPTCEQAARLGVARMQRFLERHATAAASPESGSSSGCGKSYPPARAAARSPLQLPVGAASLAA